MNTWEFEQNMKSNTHCLGLSLVEILQCLTGKANIDKLEFNYYETVEISVLGHYLPSSIHALKSFIDYTQPSIATKSNKTDSR